MVMAEITEKLTAINNQYEIYELMRHCPHNENVYLKISPYTKAEDQVSAPFARIFLSYISIN